MATFLRRYVYLVVDGQRPGTFDLRRINMSRFFNPRSPPIGCAAAAIVDAARLPRPCMTFYASSSGSEQRGGRMMNFMLVGRDKVLATDQTGRATVYDAGLGAMRTAPTLSKAKLRPAVSVPVAEKLLVLGSTRRGIMAGEEEEHCFEAVACECVRSPEGNRYEWYDDWRCHPLPTPPYSPAAATRAYAVVHGSELWVSTEEDGGGGGTYSFDVGRGSWAKLGDWTLPFCGLAEYVADLKLWFGLSSDDDGSRLCALDLAATRHSATLPVLRSVWEDPVCSPKEWAPFTCSVVHLGSGKFCIARFFRDTDGKMMAVFAGVEVVPYGRTGKLLWMVKHKSECYGREIPSSTSGCFNSKFTSKTPVTVSDVAPNKYLVQTKHRP